MTLTLETRVWNELRPKLFHQHLVIYKVFWKRGANLSCDLLTLGPFVPKEAQIERKFIIVLIENWKEIGPWFWFIWVIRWLFLILAFWPSSGGKLEPKLNQNFKNLSTLKFSVKIWAFQNPLNGLCTTMRTTCGQNVSSIWRCLLELLSPNPATNPPPPPSPIPSLLKENGPTGSWSKKRCCFI